MELIISRKIQRRIKWHLTFAGKREIGGIIMAEELGNQKFKIMDFTVDKRSGTDSTFTRDVGSHNKKLNEFFTQTGSDYKRFNYLAEWHSHPSFEAYPSPVDVASMRNLVNDSNDIQFSVLLITRLSGFWKLEFNAMLFVRGEQPSVIKLVKE